MIERLFNYYNQLDYCSQTGRRRRRRQLDDLEEISQLVEANEELGDFEQGDTTELSKQQVEQPDDTGARLTTSLVERKFVDEKKRRDALVQQEALDSLNLAAYTSDDRGEDEVLETTTEVIEFNLNGEQNKYIVKKEVQAVIVDNPEFDATYPVAG